MRTTTITKMPPVTRSGIWRPDRSRLSRSGSTLACHMRTTTITKMPPVARLLVLHRSSGLHMGARSTTVATITLLLAPPHLLPNISNFRLRRICLGGRCGAFDKLRCMVFLSCFGHECSVDSTCDARVRAVI
ncbi:hypothetical protein CB0940_10370 [Cercospora beticola]|uniref:Uncharacterized protein n=1 Tax=Cercospora beticola TaxID=122368 RepID=A0A2G5HTH2_CERBT|nr:hypothetical protein CB0940_10370 [Cercospora beticola]PIA95830.1 hypothetical protein CB0940_10370 [Cercospora beticola]